MNTMDLIEFSQSFYHRLGDDLSRKLFLFRVQYALDRNIWKFRDNILDTYAEEEWEIPELDRITLQYDEYANIVIFGAGTCGKYVAKLLSMSRYKSKNIMFCDNDPAKQGKEYCGKKVISSDELFRKYEKSIVIVAVIEHMEEIVLQLAAGGFFGKKVLIPFKKILYALRGHQYFDCFKPIEDEVFIDCGCYDGSTCADFSKWCGGDFKEILAFEANPDFQKRCQDRLTKLGGETKLIYAGTWDSATEISFINDHSAGSRVSDKEGCKVKMESIDNVIMGKKASFIKMDVEGSEYKSIQGAEDTIRKHRPRLAISIYHKAEDIFELPYLINRIRDDYQYKLVQYMSDGDETVLYAF